MKQAEESVSRSRRGVRAPRAALRVVAALVPALMAAGAQADEAAAWAALRQGGAVALMRHAQAPGPPGDPAGFRLDDCRTQRNLSAQGRAQAQAMGTRLRAERIVFSRVVSSPWCRCVETARLLDLGPVRVQATFGNAYVLADQRQSLTAGARQFVSAWKEPSNLLVVTHGANIQALLGAGPMSGETVVVSARPDGSLHEHGRIAAPVPP